MFLGGVGVIWWLHLCRVNLRGEAAAATQKKFELEKKYCLRQLLTTSVKNFPIITQHHTYLKGSTALRVSEAADLY